MNESLQKSNFLDLFQLAKIPSFWAKKICRISYKFFQEVKIRPNNWLPQFGVVVCVKTQNNPILFLWNKSTLCLFFFSVFFPDDKKDQHIFVFTSVFADVNNHHLFSFASFFQTSHRFQSTFCHGHYVFWELSTIWVAFLPRKRLLFCTMGSYFVVQQFTNCYLEKERLVRILISLGISLIFYTWKKYFGLFCKLIKNWYWWSCSPVKLDQSWYW